MAADLADMRAKLTVAANVTGGELLDRFGTKLNKVGTTADVVNKQMASLTSGVRALAAGFGAVRLAELVADVARVTIQLDAFEKQLSIGFGGAAPAELAHLRDIMRGLGIAQEESLGSAVRFTSAMKMSGQSVAEANRNFEAASKLILSNKLNAEGSQRVYYALAQVASKGKLYAEELQQQLGENLAGFTQQVASAMNMTTAELQKAMKDGKVSADEFFKALQQIGDGVDPSKLNSAAQSLGKVKNAWFDLKSGFMEASTVKTALDDLAGAIRFVADNGTLLTNVIIGGTIVAMGRSGAAAISATAARMAETAATRAQLLAEVQAAQGRLAEALAIQRATAAQFAYAESIVGTITAERALGAQMAATAAQVSVASAEMAAAQRAAVAAGAGVGIFSRAATGLGAFLGGPWGIAIMAAAGAIWYFSSRVNETEEATKRLTSAISTGTLARNNAIDLSNRYASALGKERAEILANIRAELALARARLTNARVEQAAALTDNDTHLRAFQNRQKAYADNPDRQLRVMRNDTPGVMAATERLLKATDNLRTQQGVVAELENALNGKGSLQPVAAPPPALSATGAGGSHRAGGGASGPTEVQILKSYADELKRLTSADLSVRREMLTTAEDRLADDNEANLVESRDNQAKLDANKHYTNMQRALLEAAADRLFNDRAALAAKKYHDAIEHEAAAYMQADLEGKIAAAQLQQSFLVTARDRRIVAERLLDLEYQLKKAKLDEVLATTDAASNEYKIAQLRLQQLNEQQGLKRRALDDQYAGPMAKYRKELNDSLADVPTRLEEIQVSGIKTLEDGLLGVINGTKDVASAFSDMANQIIADLARIAVEKFILQPLMGLFANGGAFSGGAQMFANGGAFANGVEFFASGGVVSRPTAFGMSGGRMGVMGEAGPEAIMPLRRLSNGRLGVESAGGGTTNNVSVAVSVEGGGSKVQANTDQAAQLGNLVAAAVRTELVKQQRPGGLLAQSR